MGPSTYPDLYGDLLKSAFRVDCYVPALDKNREKRHDLAFIRGAYVAKKIKLSNSSEVP
jgi:hypothetical protein